MHRTQLTNHIIQAIMEARTVARMAAHTIHQTWDTDTTVFCTNFHQFLDLNNKIASHTA
jgi:hypothetical protein